MPIKKFFQGNQKDVQQRLEQLENQMKKINTLEVYMKRFVKVEEHLGLLNFREKINKKEATNRTKTADNYDKAVFIKDVENQVLSKVKQMVQMEMEPIQNLLMEFHSQISKMENQIAALEKQNKEYLIEIQDLQQKKFSHEETVKEDPQQGQPIIFQEIHVEKLFMDKYEQTNNMGQLGIKELSGNLTIGASYEKGVIPNDLAEEWKEEMNHLNQIKKDEFKHNTDAENKK